MRVVFECSWREEDCASLPDDRLQQLDPIFRLHAEQSTISDQPSCFRVVRPDSILWPSSRICLSDNTTGVITLHVSSMPDDLFVSAAELDEKPLLPDLSGLAEDQRSDVQKLIEEFNTLFSKGKSDLGRVNPESEVFHRIELKPDSSPPTRLRAMSSYSEREIEFIEKEVAMLIELGIVKASSSPWISAPVCVKKQDGELRLCIDFRPLNKCTVPDPYPLPLIDNLLRKMSKAKYITTVDIASAFWQIPMYPAHTKYTGFITPRGKYEWLRMPFGLKNASSTFQRFMDEVLEGCPFAQAYMDDVFIFSQTWEEHCKHLREVFTRLNNHHVKLKLGKCAFGAPEVKCLGHIVGNGLIKPDPDNVSDILSLPVPRDVTSLRSVLGAAGYYREYIHDFALITAPMAKLLKKNVPFVWSAECQEAYNELKRRLTSDPVLKLPDFSRPFILTTDWSKLAIGAVLSQIDPETGFDHPVAFKSRLLTPAESNYAPTEGECLALVWAVQKFRVFLDGRHFTIYTDHQALQWLDTKRHQNSKLERWALRLQEYDFTVKYKKGEENLVADCLSRCATISAIFVLAVSPVWPQTAKKQKELDDVPCVICGDPHGDDNIVICDGCRRCFHLRCLLPPRSTVPSGEWFCPACDLFCGERGVARLREIENSQTPLQYHPWDPYLDPDLLGYVRAGHAIELLHALPPRAALDVRRRGSYYMKHPVIDEWLMIFKKVRRKPACWLVCPPVQFRWDVIAMVHDVLGHSGITQTLVVVHQHFHWVGMKSDIELYVSTCEACQRVKARVPDHPPLQHPVEFGPLNHVHIDLFGPMLKNLSPKAPSHNNPKLYVVVMVDYFTKVAELYPVVDKSSLNVARAFFHAWICRYGVPENVTSDNGQEFSGDFAHMLKRLNIKHIHTSPNHPSANGTVERVNQNIKRMLTSHFNEHPTDWVECLPQILHAYMRSPHEALNLICPFEMLLGFLPKLPIAVRDVLVGVVEALSPAQYVVGLQDKLRCRHDQIQLVLQRKINRNILAKLRPKANKSAVTVGDLVLEIGPSRGPLRTNCRGPYLVIALDESGTHATLSTGGTDLRTSRHFKRHTSQLVPFRPTPPAAVSGGGNAVNFSGIAI